MKYFFDTSVLVPVFVDEHPHHELSLSVFSRATKSQASCAVHSLAEVYATLTRLPSKHRASASEAMLFLENMKERLALIALDAEEYWRAMMQSAESGIVSGATYDALLAHCALKARAEAIITGNIDHFRRVVRTSRNGRGCRWIKTRGHPDESIRGYESTVPNRS